jgi:hypothetical protein
VFFETMATARLFGSNYTTQWKQAATAEWEWSERGKELEKRETQILKWKANSMVLV